MRSRVKGPPLWLFLYWPIGRLFPFTFRPIATLDVHVCDARRPDTSRFRSTSGTWEWRITVVVYRFLLKQDYVA